MLALFSASAGAVLFGLQFCVLRTENRYRSFLRVQTDNFFRRCILFVPAALVYVSTVMPFCFFVQRRSSLARRVGRCPTLCKGSALDPLGRCPRPRQGLPRPWMGGMRFAACFAAFSTPQSTNSPGTYGNIPTRRTAKPSPGAPTKKYMKTIEKF